MKIYGTDLCPDCVEAKKNIPYDYVDITASIGNLKAFVKMRDEEPAFDEAKKAGAVGVPAFVLDDGEIRLEIEI